MMSGRRNNIMAINYEIILDRTGQRALGCNDRLLNASCDPERHTVSRGATARDTRCVKFIYRNLGAEPTPPRMTTRGKHAYLNREALERCCASYDKKERKHQFGLYLTAFPRGLLPQTQFLLKDIRAGSFVSLKGSIFLLTPWQTS